MPVVCIAEPVPETRELLARLAARRGHRVVLWLTHDGLGPDAPEVEVLLFEPLSALGRDALAHIRTHAREAVRIAITDAHETIPDDHGAHYLLVQPFSPADLSRLLDAADQQPAAVESIG